MSENKTLKPLSPAKRTPEAGCSFKLAGKSNPRLALFFEGTGQGAGEGFTNVTRLRDACAEGRGQKLFLAPGPGTAPGEIIRGHIRGKGWDDIFESAREWFEGWGAAEPRVYLFGFSRGALIARHFAGWLEGKGVGVRYMGLWDTVDATVGLDVPEECPANVKAARHAVARDEFRRFFDVVPLRGSPRGEAAGQEVREMVFPGSHSDVGGLYGDNHVIADVTLGWIAAGARRAGLRFREGVDFRVADAGAAVVHDSAGESTNLWGVLGKVGRKLEGMRRHPLCKRVGSRFAK